MRKQIRVMFLADITALTSDKLSQKLRRLTAPDELKKTLQVYFPDMDENSILLIDGEYIPAAVKSIAARWDRRGPVRICVRKNKKQTSLFTQSAPFPDEIKKRPEDFFVLYMTLEKQAYLPKWLENAVKEPPNSLKTALKLTKPASWICINDEKQFDYLTEKQIRNRYDLKHTRVKQIGTVDGCLYYHIQ